MTQTDPELLHTDSPPADTLHRLNYETDLVDVQPVIDNLHNNTGIRLKLPGMQFPLLLKYEQAIGLAVTLMTAAVEVDVYSDFYSELRATAEHIQAGKDNPEGPSPAEQAQRMLTRFLNARNTAVNARNAASNTPNKEVGCL